MLFLAFLCFIGNCCFVVLLAGILLVFSCIIVVVIHLVFIQFKWYWGFYLFVGVLILIFLYMIFTSTTVWAASNFDAVHSATFPLTLDKNMLAFLYNPSCASQYDFIFDAYDLRNIWYPMNFADIYIDIWFFGDLDLCLGVESLCLGTNNSYVLCNALVVFEYLVHQLLDSVVDGLIDGMLNLPPSAPEYGYFVSLIRFDETFEMLESITFYEMVYDDWEYLLYIKNHSLSVLWKNFLDMAIVWVRTYVRMR